MAPLHAVFLDLASVDRGDLDLSLLHHRGGTLDDLSADAPGLTGARIGEAVVAVTKQGR